MTAVRELGWPLLVSLVLAPLCLALALFAPSAMGGLEYWPLSAVGAICVAVAVLTRRILWPLLLLIPIVAPVRNGVLLLFACLTGNCL